MKKLTLLFVLLAACVYAAPPAPYPFTVDSQAKTVPALQVYQAAARTFRVTFKDGTNASSLAGATPWMWWATGVTARSYYTSTCTVVSSTGGVADFLFNSVALNWSGGVSGVYGVGVTDSNGHFAVSRQGAFVISASPFGAGVAMPQATSNINCDLYTWLNPPWQNYTNSGYTMAQADAKFATGTPLYVEADAAGIAWAGTGITAAAVAQSWATSNQADMVAERAARIGADTAISNIALAALQRIASNEEAVISQVASNAWLSTNINSKLDSNTWATAQAAEIATNNQLAAWALANSNAIAAETTARIGADTALSNGLAGVGAGATSLVSAAKTDASNQFVNVGGDTMTGPLVVSNISSVGAMTISAEGVLTLTGGDGVTVESAVTFDEPLTGVGSGLSGIPISGVSGLSTALAAVGVVATNAYNWSIIASNASATAQATGTAAYAIAVTKLSQTNRWTPATAVCSTGTVQFAPGANNLYTYLPTNPFTVQMAYGVTDVGTVRFEVQASTCTITWGASIKNSGRDSSTNLTMSTTTNMSFILDKRYGESKASIYQIGL